MDIGIDLGTTFSVIAVNGKVELADDYPPGIYLEECDVTIIPSAYGEATFPSVVMQDPDTPDEYLFGSDALKKAEEGFASVMFSKRKIGTKEAIPMQTRTIVAKEVACKLLRYMKDCAERALWGIHLPGGGDTSGLLRPWRSGRDTRSGAGSGFRYVASGTDADGASCCSPKLRAFG